MGVFLEVFVLSDVGIVSFTDSFPFHEKIICYSFVQLEDISRLFISFRLFYCGFIGRFLGDVFKPVVPRDVQHHQILLDISKDLHLFAL